MSGGCCSPLGPGSGPVVAFYQTVEDDGAALPQEAALNVIGGTLADNPGNGSTDLTLFYQTVEDGDGGAFQDPVLQFSSDFQLLPGPPTRVNMTRPPLPSVGVPDAGEILQVNAFGAWDAAAHGFLGFATTALRDAYVGLRTAGMLTYVAATQCLYMLAADLTTWDFFAASPALARQASWFIAIATGSDNNSGLVGSPLKTVEEWSRRTNGLRLAQNTTVFIAAGTYGILSPNIGWSDGTTYYGKVLTFVGAITSSAAITLATSVAQVLNVTRAEVTTAAGTFVNRKRIRSTSGATSGSLTYSTGLVSATDSFCNAWHNFNSGSGATPAAGTTVAVDDWTVTIGTFDLQGNGEGYVVVQDCIVVNALASVRSDTVLGGNAGPYLTGCLVNGSGLITTTSGLTISESALGATNIENAKNLELNFVCIQNATVNVDGLNNIRLAALVMDAASVVVGNTNQGTITHFRAGDVQHCNGAGKTAWTLNPQGTIFLGNLWWGLASGGSYAVGISLQSGCWVVCSSSTTGISFPSVINYQMVGQNVTYATVNATGGNSYPVANCGVCKTPFPAAVAVNL
jgi:hypothetical protein